jgi:alpha-amylase
LARLAIWKFAPAARLPRGGILFGCRGAIRFLVANAASWVALLGLSANFARADYSPPAILQWFETSWNTMQNRAPDVFMAGYGVVQTPPPYRADSGNQSVGYDVYDRFDLGSPGNPTLYGTQAGLQAAIAGLHQAGVNVYADMVWNQDGFSQWATPGFQAAGGYPGFVLSSASNPSGSSGPIWGDFHNPFYTGDQYEQLAGLIDIAQESNNQYIRSPVPGYFNNIPAGTTSAYGRLANVPTDANRALYPDTSLNPIIVYNPNTGQQNIYIYPFNLANPMNGTPVEENALGYLMRNTQWLVQDIGYDGFRIDAAKNFPSWVLNYYDQAVYRSSFRTLLDGSQEQIFAYSEVYDGNPSVVLPYVNYSINPSNPGTIGGNRDVLDFPLFFALQNNLTGNGYQNNWYNVHQASINYLYNGTMDGSVGVKFVQSADNGAPYLSNVGYAYTLLTPGNAIVYMNGQEFGTNRSFPQQGRGDALGGVYGNAITTLLNIRNTHPSGNYIERYIDQNNFAFERDNSMVVLLSNRTDAGFDSRTISTDFAPGTPLLELTGNATNPSIDPRGDVPGLVVVNSDHTINVRFLRNSSYDDNGNSFFTGSGYLVYGLSGPQGTLSLSNVATVMPGASPSTTDNGTQVLTSVSVIRGNTFNVTLNTNPVNLLGFYRDKPADGDNALIKMDGGIPLNGDGHVDYTTPNTVSYGFDNFVTVDSPGYFNASGYGEYVQTINATQLSDGYHYITVRAFRHRDDGGPPVFTDFQDVIYVDRNPPNSAVTSFNPIVAGVNQNRNVVVTSVDQTANSVHVFMNLPPAWTSSQILALVGSGNQATQTDANLFQYSVYGVDSGNNVATIVTYRPTGSYNIQRFPGLSVSSIYGAGLGDLNFDGQINAADIALFQQVYLSNGQQFNPAADIDGDGYNDTVDAILLKGTLTAANVNAATMAAYNNFMATTPMNGIIFHPGDPSFNLQGNNIILAGPVQNTSSNNQTIGLNMQLAAGSGLFDDGGKTLTVSGILSGTGPLLKSGSGTLVLGGSNTYSGGTTISNGTLIAAMEDDNNFTNNALGLMTPASVVTVNSGGVLTNSGSNNWADNVHALTDGSQSHTYVINAGGKITNVAGTITGLGNLTLNGGTLEVNNGASSGWNGAYVLLGDVTAGGAAASQITQPGTIAANIYLTSSTANRTFTVGNGSALTIAAGLLDASGGTSSLTKAGNGLLVLSGSNTYSGGTTVSGGMFSFANLAAQPPSGTTTVANGATLGLGVSTGSAGGYFNSANLDALFSNTLANVSLSASSNVGIDTTAGSFVYSSSIGSVAYGLVKLGTNTLTLGGANTYTGGTTVNAGVLALANSAALGSGPVSVAAGAQVLVNAANMTVASNFMLNGTTPGGALVSGILPGGNVTNLSGTIALNVTSNIASWWNDKTLQLSGKITGTGGLILDLATSLGNPVGDRFYITGSTNDYQGGTTVNGSTVAQNGFTGQAMLYLGANNALPTTTTLTLNSADLYLNGYSQTLPSISGLNTFTVQNGSTTPATLTLGVGDATSAFGGVIEDNGISVTNTSGTAATVFGTVALAKIGSGTLTLSGSNAYSGGTTIDAGTLGISSSANLGTGGLAFNSGTAILDIGGATAYSDARPVTLNANGTIQVDNAAGAVLSGPITGSGALVETGSGTLALAGSNGYQGGTVLNGGTLRISSSANLGPAGLAFTGNPGAPGAILDIAGSTAYSDARPITLNANGTIQVDNTAGAQLSGAVTGSGSLQKAGNGTLTLSGSNAYSGGTIVNAGVLALTNSAALGSGPASVAAGGQVYFNVPNLTVPSSFTLNGTTPGGALVSGDLPPGNVTDLTGTVTLNATSNIASWWKDKTLQLSGQITGSGGLILDRATSLESGDPVGGRFLISGSNNNYQGSTTVNGRSAAELNWSGQGMLYLGANNALPTTTNLTLNYADLYLNGYSQQLPSIGGSGTFTVQNGSTTAATLTLGIGNATSIFSGVIEDNGISVTNTSSTAATVVGTVALAKVGSGTLTLSGSSAYSGGTTVGSGVLIFANTAVWPSSGTTSVANGATLGLRVSSSGASGYFTSANVDSLFSNTLANVSLSASSNVGIDTTAGSFSYNSSIGNVSYGLVKLGGNTLTLTGANAYEGGTTVAAGRLTLANSAALASGPVSVAAGAQVLFNVPNLTVANSFTLNGTTPGGALVSGNLPGGNVTNLTGTITLNATSNIASWWNDKTLQLSGKITGPGGLILDVATSLGNPVGGRFYITGSTNDYQGGTTVNGSTVAQNGFTGQALLYLGANNALPATTALTLNSANLYLNGYSQTLSSILGSNTFTVQNGSTTPATLTLGSGDATSAFGGVIEDNGISVSNTSSSAATIVGTVALAKIGSGTLTLSGSNAYSGGTTIDSGTLWISSPANLGTGGLAFGGSGAGILDVGGATGYSDTRPVTLNANGTIQVDAAGAVLSGLITGSGALAKAGSGMLTLASANAYTGGTSVNGGLQITNSAALGSGPVSVAAGAQVLFNAANLTVANNFTLTGLTPGGALVSGNLPGGNVTNLTGTITLNATSNISSWWNDKTLQLSGKITGTGGLILDIAQSLGNPIGGRFYITGSTNDYQGATTVNGTTVGQFGFPGQAMLYLGANNALPATTALTLNSADLYLNGYSQTVSAIFGSNTFTVQNGSTTPATLALGAGGASSTFSGVIEDNGISVSNTSNTPATVVGTVALAKVGSGTLTLIGSNAYSGGTSVNAGVLALANSAALGSGPVSVAAGGQVFFDVPNLTVANNITLAGTTPGGALVSGNLPPGNVTNLAGTITLNANSNVASWWNDKTLQLSGQVTGSGGLILDAATSLGNSVGGRFLISGSNNNYQGSTTVNGSTVAQYGFTGQAMLYLCANNALPTTTTLTLNNADLYLNGYAQQLPSINGSGSFSVQNGSTTPATLTLGGGNATSTFSGAIEDNGISVSNTNANPATVAGTVALIKTGSGTLTIAGTNNTYSGGTTVNGGTLALGGANNGASAVGSGTLTINVGATVISTATNVLGYDTSAATPPVVINGGRWNSGSFSSSFQNLSIIGGTLSQNSGSGAIWYFNQPGSISAAGNSYVSGGMMELRPAGGTNMPVNVAAGGNLTISTVLANDSGAAGINQTGSGMLTLIATNTYTGSTLISGGTLEMGDGTSSHDGSLRATGGIIDNAVLAYNLFGSQSYSGIISGSGNLTKLGGGTLTLSASNNYSGGTSVNAGVLQIVNSASQGSGPASVAAGAQIWINAGNLTIANNIVLNGTTPGGAIVSGDLQPGNVTDLSGTITLNATSNIASWWKDKTLQLSGQITGSGGLILDRATSLEYGDPVGGRFLISGSNNNYQGSTTVNGRSAAEFNWSGQAMLYLGANNALPATTNLTINYADLYLNGYSQQLPSIGGSGTFTVQNGSTTAATLTLGIGNATSTFSGVIEDNGVSVTNTSSTAATDVGSVALIKTGSGVLTLSTVNKYSGGTTIDGGTLRISSSANLGTGGLDFGGPGILDIAGSTAYDDNRPITLDASGTIQVDDSIRARLLGVIAGSGGLLKTGSGTLVLAGNSNSYSGGTEVMAGTLIVNSTGGLEDGSSLTVGQGASSLFAPAGPAAPGYSSAWPSAAASPAMAPAVTAVPEPGAFMLVLAALWSLIIYRVKLV